MNLILDLLFLGALSLSPTSGTKNVPVTSPSVASTESPKSIFHQSSVSFGYRLRADFEPAQTAVFVYNSSWPDAFFRMVDQTLKTTPVLALVDEGTDIRPLRRWERRRAARKKGSPSSKRKEKRYRRIDFVVDTPWVRDYGPFEVYDNEGDRFWLNADYEPGRPADNEFPILMSDVFDIPVGPLHLSLDGGAIASNGEAFCVSTVDFFRDTVQVKIQSGRYDEYLAELGCDSLLLVPALPGEATGHVDLFLQFTGPQSLMLAEVDAALSPEAAMALNQAERALRRAEKELGRAFRIDRVSIPRVDQDEQSSIYYSYINGFHIQKAFLMPSFSDVEKDQEHLAWQQIRRALGNTKLIPIPADDMLPLEGMVHCASLGLRL